jgi:lysyl-tRNA synthetase, class II
MSLDEIRALRLTKAEQLRAQGIEPYPAHAHRTHTIAEVYANFDVLVADAVEIAVAGRLMSVRAHGGSIFCDLFDGTEKIQVYLKQDDLGDVFTAFENIVDGGDFVEVRGSVFITKRGQKSVLVTSWKLLSKSILPIPTEWFGIQDEDDRFRKRYLDILLTKDLAERFKLRSKFWNTIRSYLLEKSFIEVETPVLENTTGGADARPFASHHNALDIDVFLRISAGELWQKRLMVAGLPRTFEIGRIFRNEGMSSEHAQDYTQLEFYMAYADYRDGMKMIQELYRKIAHEVFGKSTFTIKGFEVNLDAEWETYHFCDILKERFGVDPLDEQLSVDTLAEKLKAAGVEFKRAELNLPRGVDLLWKSVRKTLGGPGFLIGVPVYLEPLAKRSAEDPRVVERFQVILAGSENGKGFSELNDPVDQRARFEEQQSMRDAGDEEAQMADWEYVEAMEHGMPPTFGFGVSERLFSFLLDVPIREAQLFPLMRPKQQVLSKKEAEAQYRSKRFVVIADPSQGYGVAANAIGQLGISIGGLLKTKLFDQTVFLDKDGNKHYADGLYPMTNLAGTQEQMTTFITKCHAAGIQVHDFSQIMKTAHSDAEMEKAYKQKGTAEVPYIAVGALVSSDFEREFLNSLNLFGKEA